MFTVVISTFHQLMSRKVTSSVDVCQDRISPGYTVLTVVLVDLCISFSVAQYVVDWQRYTYHSSEVAL